MYMRHYRLFKGEVFNSPDFIRDYRYMFKEQIEAYENETGTQYKRGKGRPPKWEQMAKESKKVKPILKKNKGNFKISFN